ncbi:YafY family protein [Jeotgalibacillus sp. ET6]|uniref:helix-turn-helix transcriptional regulator n=1 Tax=Jeotgalibacillus sp. ET6 TaxID=3037260 RepID=UPI0024182B57|nr:YafY family protein [Jeotgalibacillus sp. ET6]MDG5473121.1 YafY family protein [Jeotgalibacillus sp. ET6]
MQKSRLFYIVYILLEKGSVTASELAEHFEVSTRTIYRDVEALSQAGVPIYAKQGKGGGIHLVDRFTLNKVLLSDKEQDEILLALQSLSAVRFPDLDHVQSKLNSLFEKNRVDWIEVDFSPWGSGKWQKEIFHQLKHAILNQQSITFDYYGSDGEKSSRKVAPIKILFKDKSWYVQGHCFDRNALRTFKLTRMADLSITDKSPLYEYPENLIAAADSKEIETNKISLKLKIAGEGAYRVYDDFNADEITLEGDGSYRINANLPGGEWLFNFLLSYGSLLEVMEPKPIRSELARRIKKMAENYF